MKLDPATLDRIAELARLDPGTAEERTILLTDMQRVLDFVEALNGVDTTGVEPLIFMGEERDVLRDDVAMPGLPREEVLKNAPTADSDYFKVPRVVGKG
ncbi:MAG: Asp-tRNA(Asn)/Glu-tRNA(Gln) amidotransferase subunit GatC [Flavobacteriales bacterium]|nr:Asp-tRNA(Asn)/Glu-tRNA(Gln) amidotransferase subunit GatC [Flavobacteriales bacterium]